MTADTTLSGSGHSGGPPATWTPAAVFTVACLGVTAGVQMSDMGLQALSLSAIQKSFAISDAALGALQGLAGVLVGSFVAIPLARFADRFSRKIVLLCLIAASTAMMVLSALAPNFPLFFIGRSAAGITEFAMIPLVYSMIPDLAPDRHRVAANLSFAALMAAGASGGFYFGGALLAAADQLIPLSIEAWRKAFLLLSTAGIPLLALASLTLDPPRHITAAHVKATASLALFLRERWQAVGLFAGVAGCLLIAVQALNQLVTLAL
ncbi:MAG: MFS transporter [Sphingobium sp.]